MGHYADFSKKDWKFQSLDFRFLLSFYCRSILSPGAESDLSRDRQTRGIRDEKYFSLPQITLVANVVDVV